MPKPFVIFTMRRSGGTAFASFLTRVGKGEPYLSEPFNTDRLWGDITRDYLQNWDRGLLRARIDGVLAERPSLKHCVDVIPRGLTEALVSACRARDYAIFVLQRGREKDRLMSLFLAMATDAWGPKDAATIYPRIRAGEVAPKRIDLETIRERAKADSDQLGQVVLQLRAAQTDFGWLVLEEILRDPAEGAKHLCEAARRIGVGITAGDYAVATYYQSGRQASSEIEPFIPGAKGIRAWLEKRYGEV